jgi:transposase
LAGWIHDLCAELGLPCQVANTASEAWKFKQLKRKTDRDDALRLAQLYALGQLPTVAVPPPETRQRRALIVYRLRLTHGGKTKRKQAIVALARKLLVRAWAMLRDQKPWREPTPVPGPRGVCLQT